MCHQPTLWQGWLSTPWSHPEDAPQPFQLTTALRRTPILTCHYSCRLERRSWTDTAETQADSRRINDPHFRSEIRAVHAETKQHDTVLVIGLKRRNTTARHVAFQSV
jgi:hypothetical protein